MSTIFGALKRYLPTVPAGNTATGASAILAGLLLMTLSMSLHAIGDTLSLQSAIARALGKNPSLKVFEFRSDVLAGRRDTARLSPAYQLEFEAENFAGSGDFNGFDAAELTVALSSTIEMGGKRRARIDVADHSQARFAGQRQVDALALLGDVTRRYIDVLAAQERLALASQADLLAKNVVNEVKKRAGVGAAPEAEVKRAEAAAAQAHLTVSAQAQQLAYLKVALAALWGASEPDFARVEGSLYQFGDDIGFDTLYRRVEQNPAILVFAAEDRLKEAEVRLAQTQASTDIRWSVGVRQLQETDDTAVVTSFSMPLFSARRNSGAIRSAMASRNELLAQKELALLQLRTQLYRAFSNRQQAIHAARELKRDIVPALEQALQATRQAYQSGRYRYLDYIAARQELLSARRTLIDAAAAALRYGAEIEQLTAEPLAAESYLLSRSDPRSQTFSGLNQ